jgi:hypothetical protein
MKLQLWLVNIASVVTEAVEATGHRGGGGLFHHSTTQQRRYDTAQCGHNLLSLAEMESVIKVLKEVPVGIVECHEKFQEIPCQLRLEPS